VEVETSKTLEADPPSHYDDGTSTIYALDLELRITYHNAAWDRFAVENGAPQLAGSSVIGQPIADAVPERLKGFYEKAFRGVIESTQMWEHLYECSSPDLYRRFHMRVLPYGKNGLIVIHSKVAETAVGDLTRAPQYEYVGRGGMVTMCSHCRRTLRAGFQGESWDWVREFIVSPPERCSHGLCPACVAHYYPGLGQLV
jgi:hypothetical protein